jgi:hypothetical protein
VTAALMRQTAERLDFVVEEVGGPYQRTIRSWLAVPPDAGHPPAASERGALRCLCRSVAERRTM